MCPLIEFIGNILKWFYFLFLNGTLADLVKAIDAFGKLAVTGTFTCCFRADLDNCLPGRFFSLLVARFATLWLPKTLN